MEIRVVPQRFQLRIQKHLFSLKGFFFFSYFYAFFAIIFFILYTNDNTAGRLPTKT